MQVAAESSEEIAWMLTASRFLVVLQDNRRTVASGAIQPNVRLCLGRSPGLTQHLHRGFIGLQNIGG